MISKFLITGDTHSDFSRFFAFNKEVPEGETWGVIILGDAGLNFWYKAKDENIANRDKINKKRVSKKYRNLQFFCVRGNHEARPEDIPTMEKVFNPDVGNSVYWESKYPNIFYLLDGREYHFHNYIALVIGGAYSIDKWYRLDCEAQGSYGGWFENEQLNEKERNEILNLYKGQSVDLILSHTCPWSWEPRDLFLSFIDQSKVDESMEFWLDQIKEQVDWKVWLCGHFHDDRILASHAEMLSLKVKDLDDIMGYWDGI